MYYHNRGNQQFYGTGCSLFGCMIALIILSFIVRGRLYLFFRYLWLIILLGVIVWVFRKFKGNGQNSSTYKNDSQSSGQDWHRDFENRENTSYHNIDREFEEVDDEDD